MSKYSDSDRDADDRIIVDLLQLARSSFGMKAGFVSEIDDDLRIFRYVDADADFDVIKVGQGGRLEESYCQLVIEGGLPGLVRDAQRECAVRHLPATHEIPIGAHLSVPLVFEDGTVYGTFCCFSNKSMEYLAEKDFALFKSLAQFTVAILERRRAGGESRRLVLSRLHEVIENKSFVMHYQPIFRLSHNEIIGYEALARFTAEPIRSPDHWFNEAIEVGLNCRLEEEAVRLALEALDKIPEHLYVSVNLTPETILAGSIVDILNEYPLGRVVVEVTEHSSVEDYDRVERLLHPLRDQGLRLAVDDAGAGYASFRHILRLKPDIIKLDSSLVQQIDKDDGIRALASALIRFAEEVDAKIVAEGVETESELAVLRMLNVDKVQGYLIGRPEPL